MTTRKFGRRVVVDERDRNYPVRPLLAGRAVPQAVYWDDSFWTGDQGQTPRCVPYAGLHYIEAGPVRPRYSAGKKPPYMQPGTLYNACQKVDGIAMPHDGTTVRALGKVFKARGLISEYRWAFTINELIKTVLTVGPVVMGTNWYEGMMGDDYLLRPTGKIVGGHGWLIMGCDNRNKEFKMKNSWGNDWCANGHAWITFADTARLLRENGEAMLATELI